MTRFACSALLSFLFTFSAHAEVGITDDAILIGMTNAQSGAYAAYGLGIKTGTEVYFNKVNQQGGVLGRKLKLVTLDDHYEPRDALENIKTLVEKDKVFALLGFFGTPTIRAVFPYVVKSNVPFIFPRSGSTFLRTPVTRNIFTLNAGYSDEAAELVRFFVEKLKLKEIALFGQDDALGAEGKLPTVTTLKNYDLNLSAEGKYNRDTGTVFPAVQTIATAKPQAVITFGAFQQTLNFVHELVKLGQSPFFGIPTPAGTQAFLDGLGPVEKVYRTEVMPDVSEKKIRLISDYQADMKKAGHEIMDQNSLRAYASAIVLVEALKSAGKDLTQLKLIESFEKMRDFDMGGLKVSFSLTNHQGMHTIYLDQVVKGKTIRVSQTAD